jgi:hypothetical protein
MYRAWIETRLALAERHVTETRASIAVQRIKIASLEERKRAFSNREYGAGRASITERRVGDASSRSRTASPLDRESTRRRVAKVNEKAPASYRDWCQQTKRMRATV